MARHGDDDEVVVVEKHGSPVVPFVWGLAIGAGLALLFAPMSGADLRANIRSRGKQLKDLAAEKAEELEDLVAGGYEKARARVEAGLETAKQRVHEGRQVAHDVVEAGRGAALTAREELEKRLADARESRRGARQAPKDEEPGA
ncbi:MAG TPA: YtxH domain-containing protein [Gemmatimonadales bacterium]|nr:YtxH domain-containing protein [Gemmatimonadales bacterium]